MALTQEERYEVFAKLARYWSSSGEELGVNKADLIAAINDFDQAIDDNASTINSWIPQPARANMTLSQKLEMWLAILLKRRP